MSVAITVNDRVLVSGAFDGSLGKIAPCPDVLESCSVSDLFMLGAAYDLLGELLGKSGAVTRDELREVVREEVRAAVRTSLVAGFREAQAPVTY